MTQSIHASQLLCGYLLSFRPIGKMDWVSQSIWENRFCSSLRFRGSGARHFLIFRISVFEENIKKWFLIGNQLQCDGPATDFNSFNSRKALVLGFQFFATKALEDFPYILSQIGNLDGCQFNISCVLNILIKLGNLVQLHVEEVWKQKT